MKRILALILASTFSSITYASAADKFPTAFQCHYPTGYVWKDDGRNYEGKQVADFSDVTFVIDSKASGRMIGNAGASDVAVLVSNNISFIEQTDTGNLAITTLFLPADNDVMQPWKSVHSRHMDLAGRLIVSQYVGTCQPKN